MDITQLQELWQLLLAVALAIIAVWEWMKKNDVLTTLVHTENQINALVTPQAATPEVVYTIPSRAWQMSPETLHWLKVSESPEDQSAIENQVMQNEMRGSVSYQIVYSRGGYQIEYGLIKSSWKGSK